MAAYIEIETDRGPQRVRVCEYCRTVCIPSGRFCSGRCARQFDEMMETRRRGESPVVPCDDDGSLWGDA